MQRLTAVVHAKEFAQQSSEIGDERPIAGCEFSPDGSSLATCGEWVIFPFQSLLLGHSCSFRVDGRMGIVGELGSEVQCWSQQPYSQPMGGAWQRSVGAAVPEV